MIHDRVVSRLADPDQSAAAGGLSRRRFLHAGAAAGGGLMLSLSLPFSAGEARAADTETFAPNAFIRIHNDGQVVLVMPYVEMGQGTYTSIPMLIAEELEVDLGQVRLEHAPPDPKAVRQPRARRHPGDRRLDLDTGGVAPAARGGRRCANHAGLGGGEALECRSRVLPRAERRSSSPADGATGQIWRARRRRRAHACPGKRRAQAAARVHADRHAGQAPRYAGEGQRNGRLRHRRPAAGSEDRDACPVAGLWRPGQERGRQGGHGGQRRAPGRDASTTRSRSWPTIWARPGKGSPRSSSNGTRGRTPSSPPTMSRPSSNRRR